MAYSAIPIPSGGAGGGSDGRRILNTWEQASHGLFEGQAVFYDGTKFVAALASMTGASANAVGLVESKSANAVTVVYQGEVDFGSASLGIDDGAVSLTAGVVYHLSDVTPGNLKPSAPSSPNSIIVPILVATAAKKGIVMSSLGHQQYSASIMTPVGTIVPWAGQGNLVPPTWTLCDGRALLKTDTEYSELYSIIGDKYKVTASCNVTPNSPPTTAVLSFTGDAHEDGVEFAVHGLQAVANSGTDSLKDFVIGWGGTNDYAVARVTSANSGNKTVTFSYQEAYPGTSITDFTGMLTDTPVTIRSLASGEVAGRSSGWFFIPDLRARTVMGVGKTTGLTEIYRGDVAGNQTHLLTTDEIPDHDNVFLTATGSTDSGLPALNVTAFTDAENPQPFNASFTADNEAISLLNPYVATNWIIRHKRFSGAGYEVGPQGLQGPVGPTGATGECCECPTPGEGGAVAVTYISKDGSYGGGNRGPYGFSSDPNLPTNWDYIVPLTTTNVLTRTIDPPDVTIADASGVDRSTEIVYDVMSGLVTPRPNSGQPINRSTGGIDEEEGGGETPDNGGGVDTRDPCAPGTDTKGLASAIAGPQAWIFSEGIYTLPRPIYNSTRSRDTYIGSRSGSVVNRKITSVEIQPILDAGVTRPNEFYMTFDTTGQSGGTAGIAVGGVILVRGLSGGATGGLEGSTGGTPGFYDRLIGPYVVNGITDSKVQVIVYSQSVTNSWFSPHLNTTTNSYITDIDIYKVTFLSSSQGGAFFSEPGSRTFIGRYTLPNGVSMDGVAIVNGAGSINLQGDPAMLPFIPENQYSNAIGIQTKGGLVETSRVAIVKYPAGVHGTDDARLKLNNTHISHCYFGASVEDDSSLTLRGSSISRSSIPIAAKEGSTVKITDNRVRRSKLMGNRAPIVVKGGSTLDMDQTVVRGSGVYANQSTVNINRFTDIYNDLTADAPATGSTQGVPENRFAIMGVDSLISLPNIDAGATAYNPLTSIVESKILVSGVAQFFDTKVRGSISKTNATISVAEDIQSDRIYEYQIPKETA